MAEQPRMWRLDARQSTLLLYASNPTNIPQLIWFASKLPADIDIAAIAAISDLPMPMAKLDAPVAYNLFPEQSSGSQATPALRGHRNGRSFAHVFSLDGIDESTHGLTINLSDAHAALSVILQIDMHPESGVATFQTTLINNATDAYTVDWLASASLPVPEHYAECLLLAGRWGLEFQSQRQSLRSARLLLESNSGRTSHELYPGVVAGVYGFSEQNGDVLAAQLAWSGSHRTILETLVDGTTALQSGIALDPGELTLEAGAAFTSPALHVTTGHGLNQASQAMHRFARDKILPPWTRTTRPIHANSWEALYFDHDIDKLKALIDASAQLGAERFVLDDGWFEARRGDNAGLGDWWVDRSVYPDGLHPIADHTRKAGLQFGLWFEPEMVNPDSTLFREHPDWVLQLSPYETPLARNQLTLDMDNQQVQDYLFNKISALINEYKIDYIKWDFNRDLVLAGDGSKSRLHKQPTGSYRLMEALNKTFPDLEIESCSSGGARADWGVLTHTGRVWTSDSIDAIDRVKIQRGYSIFNPPEIMGAHIGHEKAHLTGRSIDLHTRAIVALQGQFGFELDARHVTADEAVQLKHYVDLYKQHRQWIASSTVWRLDTHLPALTASGLVSQQQTNSLWFVIATDSLAGTNAGKLFPCGLDPQSKYTIKLASNNLQHFKTFSKKVPHWLTTSVAINGELLMQTGITLPIMPAQSALLIEINCA